MSGGRVRGSFFKMNPANLRLVPLRHSCIICYMLNLHYVSDMHKGEGRRSGSMGGFNEGHWGDSPPNMDLSLVKFSPNNLMVGRQNFWREATEFLHQRRRLKKLLANFPKTLFVKMYF